MKPVNTMIVNSKIKNDGFVSTDALITAEPSVYWGY